MTTKIMHFMLNATLEYRDIEQDQVIGNLHDAVTKHVAKLLEDRDLSSCSHVGPSPEGKNISVASHAMIAVISETH